MVITWPARLLRVRREQRGCPGRTAELRSHGSYWTGGGADRLPCLPLLSSHGRIRV